MIFVFENFCTNFRAMISVIVLIVIFYYFRIISQIIFNYSTLKFKIQIYNFLKWYIGRTNSQCLLFSYYMSLTDASNRIKQTFKELYQYSVLMFNDIEQRYKPFRDTKIIKVSFYANNLI